MEVWPEEVGGKRFGELEEKSCLGAGVQNTNDNVNREEPAGGGGGASECLKEGRRGSTWSQSQIGQSPSRPPLEQRSRGQDRNEVRF
jgi:hypothetical protein